MYKTPAQTADYLRTFLPLVAGLTGREVMIAPPFPALETAEAGLRGSSVALGAQDVFWENEGAFTGQVSAVMLRAVGCRYAIIGHSERRQFFGETDDTVNRKIRAAVSAGLVPVMCVGESESERDGGRTLSILDKQVKSGLKGFFAEQMGSLVIAYEPVWAIGTGKTATSAQAQEAHRFIRSLIEGLLGSALAAGIRVLYGGSVKPDNVSELMAMPDIDGGLVGGASLNPESFAKIVQYKSEER
jgi:triosephosphate isomerase